MCKTEGCNEKKKSWGYCSHHYEQNRKAGTLDIPKGNCVVCSTEFIKKRSNQKCCSKICSNNFHKEKQRSSRQYFDPVKDAEYLIDYVKNEANIDEETGCWNWPKLIQGYPATSPYAMSWHRVMCSVKNEGHLGLLVAHHTCSNTGCVNPDHLQAVTDVNNQAEMIERRRYIDRIKRLEEALAELDPSHPLLEVAYPTTP